MSDEKKLFRHVIGATGSGPVAATIIITLIKEGLWFQCENAEKPDDPSRLITVTEKGNALIFSVMQAHREADALFENLRKIAEELSERMGRSDFDDDHPLSGRRRS